jgi:hypothetical protein
MAKYQTQPQNQHLAPPPPYEEVEAGLLRAGEDENTPLMGRVSPFPYGRNRRWRFLRVLFVVITMLLLVGIGFVVVGGRWKGRGRGKGEEEVRVVRVGVVGECFFLFFWF